MKSIVSTPNAPGAAEYGRFSYSQAVVAAGLVFVAGQGACARIDFGPERALPQRRRSAGRAIGQRRVGDLLQDILLVPA